MKKFIRRFCLVSLPVLLVIGTLNYIGDAGNLFSKDYEQRVAKEIVKGRHVTNVYNYDERIMQRELITRFEACPEVVVLGSSRVMQINSEHFPGKRFFNHGVSGASIEDLFAMVQLYDEKHCTPQRVILGLDPWTLNANSGLTRYRTLYLEYKRFLEGGAENSFTDGVKQFFFRRANLLELFSPSYLQHSVNSLLNTDKTIYPTTEKVHDTFTKLSDGSIQYDLLTRGATEADVAKRASSFLNGKAYGIEDYAELDAVIESRLEMLVDHLLRKQVEVEFFLAPYHPDVFAAIQKSEKYAVALKSEAVFVALAARKGITVIGSFDPKAFGLVNADFYDGQHPNVLAIDGMVRSFHGH